MTIYILCTRARTVLTFCFRQETRHMYIFFDTYYILYIYMMIFSERLVHGDGGGDILNRHDSLDFT